MELDVGELRRTILELEQVAEQVREFKLDRITKIDARQEH